MNHPQQGPYGPGQVTPPPGGRTGRRTGIWIALGCLALVVVLGFLAVTGGVIYLATQRGGGDGEETTATAPACTVSEDLFRLECPAGWEEGEPSPDSGMVLRLQGEARIVGEDEVVRDEFVVYRFSSDLHAVAECEQQAIWLGFDWDETGDPEALDPTELDGKDAAHHRITGSTAGVDAVEETWCIDVGDEVVQITAAAYGTTELTAQIQGILDSWTWADGVE